MNREDVKKLIYEQQTKLAPSQIPGAGVGVFAIVKIPKDTLIKGCTSFKNYANLKSEGDLGPSYDIHLFKWDEFDNLDDKIKDYLLSMTDSFGNNFWIDAPPFMFYQTYYINHSNTPNCFWDRRSGDIYSQVEISIGEELTMYYMPSEREWEL